MDTRNTIIRDFYEQLYNNKLNNRQLLGGTQPEKTQ